MILCDEFEMVTKGAWLLTKPCASHIGVTVVVSFPAYIGVKRVACPEVALSLMAVLNDGVLHGQMRRSG